MLSTRIGWIVFAGLTLTVTSGWGQASFGEPPRAVAGGDREVSAGTSVLLDGRSSFDPEGSALTYQWSFAGRPTGSRAVLFGAGTFLASFTPDVGGDYFAQLTVSDGGSTGADAIRVRAQGASAVARPEASISGAGQFRPGDRIILSGAASTSPAGVTLTYLWKQVLGPSVTLEGVTAPAVSFVPFDPGQVGIELTVADGAQASSPTTVSVIVLAVAPAAPVVDAGPEISGTTSQRVTLAGRVLEPAGPGTLSLRWTYESGPVAALAVLDRATPRAAFVPPVPGTYAFRFVAADGQSQAEDRTIARVFDAQQNNEGGSSLAGCALGGRGSDSSALLSWLLCLGMILAAGPAGRIAFLGSRH